MKKWLLSFIQEEFLKNNYMWYDSLIFLKWNSIEKFLNFFIENKSNNDLQQQDLKYYDEVNKILEEKYWKQKKIDDLFWIFLISISCSFFVLFWIWFFLNNHILINTSFLLILLTIVLIFAFWIDINWKLEKIIMKQHYFHLTKKFNIKFHISFVNFEKILWKIEYNRLNTRDLKHLLNSIDKYFSLYDEFWTEYKTIEEKIKEFQDE